NPPALSQGTRIYDAVNDAVDLIDRAGLSVGTVVLLSDGADTGSKTSPAELASTLKKKKVRVFTVGLESKTYKPAALQHMAAAGKGTYSAASSPDSLAAIYDALGFRLAHEYLLQYVSSAPAGQNVDVSVRVGSLGTATAGYRTPALPIEIQQPIHPSIFDRAIRSSLAMLVIALAIVGLIAYAVWGVFRTPKPSMVERMSDFVTITT